MNIAFILLADYLDKRGYYRLADIVDASILNLAQYDNTPSLRGRGVKPALDCSECDGTGWIVDPDPNSSVPEKICKKCKGSGEHRGDVPHLSYVPEYAKDIWKDLFNMFLMDAKVEDDWHMQTEEGFTQVFLTRDHYNTDLYMVLQLFKPINGAEEYSIFGAPEKALVDISTAQKRFHQAIAESKQKLDAAEPVMPSLKNFISLK